jgi:serine/threonine-protein kinase
MDDRLGIRNPASFPTDTGGSFDHELRELLRKRTRLMLMIAVGVVVALLAVELSIAEPGMSLHGGLAPLRTELRLVHLLTFGVAALLTYVLKGPARQFQLLAFWVIALNLVFAIFVNASLTPAEEPYFAAAISLFIFATFIPAPARYPIWLGVLAVASFAISTMATYVLVPEVEAFWAGLGGVSALTDHLTLGVSGLASLAVVAHIGSRTLYSLRRTAHEAQQLGNYVLEEELGTGGMGQVFKARHALIRRPTALKVMKVSNAEEQSSLIRFEREVQLSATLTHPNTITIFDFGRTADSKFYYAMEYLDGLDLQKLVERYGPLPPERTAYVLIQACGALSEAHARGIIHRDIKPPNIFLTRRGGLYDFVKVLDFGLAKQVEGEGQVDLTKTGMAVGTPRYISPEMVKGTAPVDGRSDLYSLGAVAYWMLAGRPPFDADSSVELLIDHLQAPPIPVSQVSELAIPEKLEAAVMRCLEKRPDDRFQSAQELADALQSLDFDQPWSQEKARDWWHLHQPDIEPAEATDQNGDSDSGLSNRGVSRFFFEP